MVLKRSGNQREQISIMKKSSILSDSHRFAEQALIAERKGNWTTACDKHESSANCLETLLGISTNQSVNKCLLLLIEQHRRKAQQIRQQIGLSSIIKRIEKRGSSHLLDAESYSRLKNELRALSESLDHKLEEVKTAIRASQSSTQAEPFFSIKEDNTSSRQPASFIRNIRECYEQKPEEQGTHSKHEQEIGEQSNSQLSNVDRLISSTQKGLLAKVADIRKMLDTIHRQNSAQEVHVKDSNAEVLNALQKRVTQQKSKIRELKKANDNFDKAFSKLKAQNRQLKTELAKKNGRRLRV